MKKSISFWSFSGKTAAQAMQLAKDAGFDGIELTLDAAGDLTMDTTDEQVLALKQTAERIGIALPSVASSLYWAYSFTSDDAAEREQAHKSPCGSFTSQSSSARTPFWSCRAASRSSSCRSARSCLTTWRMTARWRR